MNSILASVFLFLGTFTLWAQYEPPALDKWSSKSPDGLYLASTRIVPKEDGRTDLDTGRLLVVRLSGAGNKATSVSYNIPRLFAEIEWSPNSKFIVMTTVSAGGHSPWHFKSYVYCVEDNTLRYMDDVIGLVVAAKFEFVGPHTVAMKIPGPGGPEVDFENPQIKMVDLTQQAPQMPLQDGNKN